MSRDAIGYEALLREFGTDYLSVRHENVSEDELAVFFGGYAWFYKLRKSFADIV